MLSTVDRNVKEQMDIWKRSCRQFNIQEHPSVAVVVVVVVVSLGGIRRPLSRHTNGPAQAPRSLSRGQPRVMAHRGRLTVE